MSAVFALVVAATPPADDQTSPGFAGFLAIFLVALATVLLIRSMVKHLRKVQFSPDPAAAPEPGPATTRARPADAGEEPGGSTGPRPPTT